MTVQPWEPVSFQYVNEGGMPGIIVWPWDHRSEANILRILRDGFSAAVTLANGQKIIVRAKR